MKEQLQGNRIILRPADGGVIQREIHVTDVPKDLARYVGSTTEKERQTAGPINVFDNRGLLEEPPFVKIDGDLVPEETTVFIKEGTGVVSLGDQELVVHVPEVGKPIRRGQTIRSSDVYPTSRESKIMPLTTNGRFTGDNGL
jgi:hypothetical protein